MKKGNLKILLIVLLVIFNLQFMSSAHADVGVTFTNYANIAADIGSDLANEFNGYLNEAFDTITLLTGDVFALSNSSSDYVGNAMIIKWTVGIIGSIGFAPVIEENEEVGDLNQISTFAKTGLNGGLFGGLRITRNMDIITHLFYLPLKLSSLKINFFNFGASLRLKYYQRMKNPNTGIEGIVLAVGIGGSYAKVEYDKTMNKNLVIEENAAYFRITTIDGTVKLTTFYLDVSNTIYFRILRFVTLSAGAGVMFNVTKVSVGLTGGGAVDDNKLFTSSTSIGQMIVKGDNNTIHLLPHIETGITLNLWMIKIPFQFKLTWPPTTDGAPIWHLTFALRAEF